MKPKAFIFIFSFLFISLSFQLSAQKNYKDWSTKKIVKKMARNNYYEIGIFEYGMPEQASLFFELKDRATIEELVELTNHRKAVMRAYAIKALDIRKYDNLFPLILKHIHDNKIVDIKSYRVYIPDIRVGDFFVESEHLKPKERAFIDSVLIHTDNKLEFTDEVLYDLEPDPKHYNRVKQLVDKRYTAIIALARYQKSVDIPIIKEKVLSSNYYSKVDAIEFFPDEAFKPVLIQFIKNNNYRLEKAIAAYQDTFALKYFENEIEQSNKSKRSKRKICNALSKYKAPIYNELLFELWESDFKIDIALFDYLLQVDSIRSKRLAVD